MNDFLMHYGVKGQSWGIRRYQNEDGTLTEEGKERYGVGDNNTSSRSAKDLEPGVNYKNASDKALALRRKQVEKAQNNLRKQTVIQSILGASAVAAGTYMKSRGNRIAGNFIQKFGAGYLIGTGVAHVIGTGASYLAKNVLKNEEASRKKNA